jgi:hypothetical protein
MSEQINFKTLKFDDSVISTIAKTLQLALLTGTDIVDNLRQIEVTETSDGLLGVTPNYSSQFEHWVAKLLEELETQQNTETENTEEPTSLFE